MFSTLSGARALSLILLRLNILH